MYTFIEVMFMDRNFLLANIYLKNWTIPSVLRNCSFEIHICDFSSASLFLIYYLFNFRARRLQYITAVISFYKIFYLRDLVCMFVLLTET